MKELWVPLSGAIAQQRKVETIANNVANANTPGFKKDQLVFKEHLTQFEKGHDQDINLPHKEWKPGDFYKSYGAESAKVKVDGSFTDFEQGQLTPTGNSLDLALHGKGFFEILTPNGVRYTRQGALTINTQGQLVTQSGNPVLSKLEQATIDSATAEAPLPSPQERVITLPNGRMTVNLQGEILVNNQKINDLSVVEFKDIQSLRKEGNSHFINKDLNNFKSITGTNVQQGFIEQSNVNAVYEMSELIKANRQFESIQKVIKVYDTISGKGVNEIAKF